MRLDLYMVDVNSTMTEHCILVNHPETNRPFYSFSDAKPHMDIVSEADSNDGRSSG